VTGDDAPARRDAGRAWLLLALALGGGALLAWPLPTRWFDWQPGLVVAEPWRAWSAAFVHWSALHLAANLLGCALVAVLGHVAALPRRAALAWLLAWPLTHLALLLRPELAHYGGLSGVLHAAVAVAGWWLVAGVPGRARLIGAALLVGLSIKVALEDPFGPVLARVAGWDIAIAPLAHATGALAGSLAAAALVRVSRRESGRQGPR
jgi:rhomboid family GlyGly-CTERM serine protease